MFENGTQWNVLHLVEKLHLIHRQENKFPLLESPNFFQDEDYKKKILERVQDRAAIV